VKILSNKKYNELLLKPLKGCFAQVNDDQLLRENGLLYAENKKLHSIIKEVREHITSYESIETIQQFDHNKNNKDLDKLLEILDKTN